MPRRTASPRTRSIAGLAAIATGALVAGCGDDDKKSTVAAKPTPFAIEVKADGKKKLAMTFPATVKAGLVTMTLTANAPGPHSAQIVRLEGGHTGDEFLKKIVNSGEDDQGVPIPSWVQDGGGVGTVKSGATASTTQVLAPGRYVIFDDEGGDQGPPNNTKGAKGEFTVTGDAVDATLPAQPATVTATDEGEKNYGFEFAGLKAGKNSVRFENTGKQLHHALFFPLRKGATIKQAAAFLKTQGKGRPPIDFNQGVGTNVIDGGIEQNITLDLKAGRYAVLCFLNDRDGGKPHVAKGMIKELTVE